MKVDVIIPCFNEEVAIGAVIDDFKKFLPQANIYVFDNNSTDLTSDVAKRRGAQVVLSRRQGKGCVVRHSFRVLDADIYLMVDGDATYSIEDAPKLIQTLIDSQADMVVGARLENSTAKSFRKFHRFGNRLISGLITKLFRVEITDVLSGYRVFTKEFVKTVPLTSRGFEIETELTLQASDKGLRIIEVPTFYKDRPEGSFSKLRTYSDGILIFKTIFTIFKNYNPLVFFFSLAGICAVLSLIAGLAPILDFYREHYVYHLPRAILSAGLGVLSIQFLGIGLILDTVALNQRENFELNRMKNRSFN
jgi:glycosyltransferase involved in cell wall biosynthesis